MSLDGIVTYSIVKELERAVGARIHKIHQPAEHDLVFSIRGNGINGKLLLSANPTYPRVHWTTSSFINPMEAPMFCMLMRKYCEGAVIESVEQVGRERIIRIGVRHRDELGDLSSKTIVIELMGRHSNIILMDPATGTIHDGIHHVTPAISTYRIVMPGSTYTSPPDQHKTDPFAVQSEAEMEAALRQADESGELRLDRKLVAAFSGFSPLLGKELAYRASAPAFEAASGSTAGTHPHASHEEAAKAGSALWHSFSAFTAQMKQGDFSPVIVTDANGKTSFYITALRHLAEQPSVQVEPFQSPSECLEAYYGDKAERDTVKQRAGDLIRFVHNEIGKNEKKVEKLKETLEEAQDSEKYRVLGELLTAYMHQINRGDSSITLVNFYDEEQAEVTIPLDPQLGPSDNAQRYFRKYAKQKSSIAYVNEQMEIAAAEIAYFEQVLQQLEHAALADIEEIREELVAQGYLRDRSKRGPKRKKQDRPALACYTSSEGVPIYVGKNNTQNEYLTNRLASPSDTWFHTKDIPGSHVVIRGGDFGNATLEEAAMLAAHYSKARESSQVPVDYTFIRHVRKPSGAKPGFVIYDNQKTLYITPDESKLKSLPVKIV
ncbi:Rqc2 family fibronectin-binding protein [Paenibacillus protaetiae]|uniref:Rqc2 homolog RqcH n=1 Tax=Paenibacillus protaetiae TaxID=2509456 RepID=A0A4P6F543_9BACL|nr:NFACT RNA binding domain-containing protein [Paenibacillus protaetiae]QAY65508.1 fibronectin/fibrinogen-binding protein [Paenibacillus protaetiae]